MLKRFQSIHGKLKRSQSIHGKLKSKRPPKFANFFSMKIKYPRMVKVLAQ